MKHTIVSIIILLYSINLFAQTQNEINHERYWYYRDRLNKYFVYKGIQRGESQVFNNRNQAEKPECDYGQSTIAQGMYLAMLATEYKLLKLNNQNTDAQNTLDEIYLALLAHKRKDMCESGWPFNEWISIPDNFDGFFIREDAPYDFVENRLQALNQDLDPTMDVDYFINKGEPGHPAYATETECISKYMLEPDDDENRYNKAIMSQDEFNGLLVGLALVKKCTPVNSKENILAREIVDLTTKYIRNASANNAINLWRIKTPYGPEDDCYNQDYNSDQQTTKKLIRNGYVGESRGGFAKPFAWGYAKAAAWITENPIPNNYYTQSGFDSPTDYLKYSWMKGAKNIKKGYVNDMEVTLAVIGDSWRMFYKLPFVLFGGYVEENNNITYQGIKYKLKNNDTETFWLMLWKYLHNKTEAIDYNEVKSILATAPCSGPYRHGNNYVAGWASNDRFASELETHMGTGGWLKSNFNGLDYMVYYNLYQLLENTIPYTKMTTKNISGYYPNEETHIVYGSRIVAHGEVEHFIISSSSSINGSFNHVLNIQALNKIETTALVDIKLHDKNTSALILPQQNVKGKVIMTAGKEIHLKPGFEVKRGAHFEGHIKKFSCSTGSSKSLYSDRPFITALDSLNWDNTKPTFSGIDDYYSDADYYPQDTNQIKSLENNNTQYDKSYNVYPNPNKGSFILQGVNISSYEVYNIYGNLLQKNMLKNNDYIQTNINITDQPNGIYILRIYIQDKVYSEKIVKQ